MMKIKSSFSNIKLNDLKDLTTPGLKNTRPVFLGRWEEHATTIDKKWTYYINEIGFRNSWPEKMKDHIVGIYGCSNIFGVGVPDDLVCTSLLQEKFPEKTLLNFGVMGASVSHIARIFLISSQLFKIKTAFFSLPSIYRILMVNEAGYYNLHPGTNSLNKDGLEKRRKQYYQSINEETLLMNYLDIVDHIILIGKEFGIRIYFSSYEEIVHKILIENYNDSYITKPMYNSRKATDNNHPCYLCHKDYATIIEKKLLTNV